ncbi:hypothetical protein C789_1643 [Microcystis aeruginosa FACHB-905 = DIANCHI905]|uniref:Uncharacterized protein n=1 Tax=Microcystis aeruginosa PCC 7806SL TaxID=1903187 RepID=A0AB33BUM5_MICA7|nr:hypothetical protein BH695_4208 [Microcystis aeruginosa PCC 7806SL]ELS48595.1 hypothetical protein C789_1643 [Microcystis aeruginosa FACHB-905 = DIANCHI905]
MPPYLNCWLRIIGSRTKIKLTVQTREQGTGNSKGFVLRYIS